MTLTVTFGAPVADVQVTVGPSVRPQASRAAPATPPCTTWSVHVTMAPGSGTDPNRTEPFTIEAKENAVGYLGVQGTGEHPGRTEPRNQGPIANVTLASHAPANAGALGQISVTLRPLVPDRGANRLGGSELRARRHAHAPPDLHRRLSRPVQAQHEPSSCAASAGTTASATGPFDCVGGLAPGALNGLAAAYLARWGGCATNNWPATPVGDPRVIPVFLTDGVPDTPGATDDYRITGFAAFYVTGWFGDGCGAVPEGAGAGDVWGHVLTRYALPASTAAAEHDAVHGGRRHALRRLPRPVNLPNCTGGQ